MIKRLKKLNRKIQEEPSPHVSDRPEPAFVDTIVLHATVIATLSGVIKHFKRASSQVSAHYTIDKKGVVVRHVPELKKAWHAGKSRMVDGREGVNAFSIGIELVNKNNGIDPYPLRQRESLYELIEGIIRRHPIKYIVAHWEIAEPAGRKCDPLGLDVEQIRRDFGL